MPVSAMHRPRVSADALHAAVALMDREKGEDGKKVIPSSSYGTWIAEARSEFRWDYPHFLMMQEVLDAVTEQVIKRALFNVALRHGKTEHNTISYAAYRLELDPSTRILLGSYNQRQAYKLSRAIRRLSRLRGVVLSREAEAVGEWETTWGGGLRAVGAGEGVASVNADLILIDDPIGSRDDAESLAKRDQVWDWITNDILARSEPHTQAIFSMPRWHIDDPAGRMLDRQASRWHVVDLPGRAEPEKDDGKGNVYVDPLGREVDEVLWPELRGEQWHDDMRVDLGEYGYASLIQGRPRPREGGLFKWDWWKKLDTAPVMRRMIRYWDLAGTKPRGGSHDPDHTAGALLGLMDNECTCIVDMERFRETVAPRDARLLEVCGEDLKKYRGRVKWWIETETGIQGKERTANIVRKLQILGMPVYTEHPTGSKLSRAEPLASKAEAGNVYLGPGEWRDPFRVEACDFTGDGSSHDDQIDAASGADAKLSIPAGTISQKVARL